MNYGTNKVKVSYFVELPQSNFPTTQISRPFSDFGPFPLTLAEFHEISRYTEIPEKWRPCVLQTIKWWLLWHTGNDIGHADKLHRAQLVLGLATIGGSAIPAFIQATQPGHPFVCKRNEYWRWFWTLLEKKRQVLRCSRPSPGLLAHWLTEVFRGLFLQALTANSRLLICILSTNLTIKVISSSTYSKHFSSCRQLWSACIRCITISSKTANYPSPPSHFQTTIQGLR